jgi:phage gpG-like protein
MKLITMSIQNTDEVQKALRQFGAKAEKELEKAIVATALTVNGDIKKSIQQGPKTGAVYQRGSRTHQASAPGEAPATDTGFLVSSITFTQPETLTAIVASRLPYAYWLEYGTRAMQPRPSWRPAVEKNTELFQRLVDAALRRAAQ